MSWNEIVIEVTRVQAEILSDALMDAGALSVSVEDADQGTSAEQPLFGEPGMEPNAAAWERSRVVALVEADANHATIVADAARASGLTAPLQFTLRPVAEQDWVRLTQSQFDPIHIGQRIWVVPSWHTAPQQSGALILELDPGLAFGTGSHATTSLCMQWLENNANPDIASVLDYGCGSGILALVAKKLGVAQVTGVDIDPQALEAARFNSERNHCNIDYYLPQEFAHCHNNHSQVFSIVVANILAGPLQLMATMLSSHIAPGGALILSGVLEHQADDVIAAYAPYIKLSVWAEQQGWIALVGKVATA